MSGLVHASNLTSLLFTRSDRKTPTWLSEAASNCQVRYCDLPLTGAFSAALKAFDDGGIATPFELFVVGEGKFGKSTLVNCLLGEELSKVRALPETRCFLRYVLTDSPRSKVRFYIRREQGVHDWLIEELGPGRKVPALYEITEHETDRKTAKRVMDLELDLVDRPGYVPGIFEVERDVAFTSRSAFSQVRVVDTQGLDQLFPEDLKRQTAALNEASSLDAFMDWLNTTPRGKYLEWQFRRCDAVLWCVSAISLNSASTRAALQYFGAYSKKVVLAITNKDQLGLRTPVDEERFISRVKSLYGTHAAYICCVNGRAGWDAVVKGDESEIATSGLRELVDRLQQTCVREGDKVRSISKYAALSRTERQYRGALRSLNARFIQLLSQYQDDCRRIDRALESDRTAARAMLDSSYRSACNAVYERIRSIGLRDDTRAAKAKLDSDSEVRMISMQSMTFLESVVLPNVRLVVARIKPYSIPAFDAEGNAAGSQLNCQVLPSVGTLGVQPIRLLFVLEDRIFKHLWLGLKGLINKTAADAERQQIINERQAYVRETFAQAIRAHFNNMQSQVDDEVRKVYGVVRDSVDLVFKRVQDSAGGSLAQASARTEAALADISVRPVLATRFLEALRNAVKARSLARF